MSMCWENKCVRCDKEFDSFSPSDVCRDCWTDSDTKKRLEYETRIKKSDEELLLEKGWKRRAEVSETKLSKLPKWLVKLL